MSARFAAVRPPKARGMVFIHSAPAALCPHVEWALAAVLGDRITLDWTDQPAQSGARRTELSWTGPAGSGAALASRLAGFGQLRFEVTEEAAPGSDGMRFSFTPSLGAHNAVIGVHGDVLLGEDCVRRAILEDALDAEPLADALARLLGAPWDDELDVFRHATEDAPVRWLHQVG